MGALVVNELFVSIQGESSRVGLPCVFVRLTGCPLRCRWCDTTYAYDEGRTMSLEEILMRVASFGVELVEVTGGEPLMQEQTPELLRQLCDSGHQVMLETSGALELAPVDLRVRVVMDIKCPGSGMAERMHWPNLELLKADDEVKFVLADRQDYEYARQVMERHDLARRCRVLLSVVHGTLKPREVVQWMLADRLPARFQLQLHKYIWPPDQRGV